MLAPHPDRKRTKLNINQFGSFLLAKFSAKIRFIVQI